MKIISIFALLVCFSLSSNAQLFVDTLPHNKNVLIEEFTGVQCNSCPQGHIEVANLIAAHPNRVFAAGMYGNAMGHSAPYTGEEDLRRAFPDLLAPQVPGLNSIPSGIISRRKFNGKEAYIFWPFASYHAPIDSAVNAVLAEPSPFNIGVHADYDTVNKVLHVTSQVFATLNSTGDLRLNVYFTQSNILVSQLNGSTVIPNYNEKHVFREILTPTWGATMAPAGASHGDVFNFSHTFSNAARKYKMSDVDVIVFVTLHSGSTTLKGNVVTAIQVPVTLTGALSTAVNEQIEPNDLNVYPNPANGIFSVWSSEKISEMQIINVMGETVYADLGSARHEGTSVIDISAQPVGVYFLKVKTGTGSVTRKILKQ